MSTRDKGMASLLSFHKICHLGVATEACQAFQMTKSTIRGGKGSTQSCTVWYQFLRVIFWTFKMRLLRFALSEQVLGSVTLAQSIKSKASWLLHTYMINVFVNWVRKRLRTATMLHAHDLQTESDLCINPRTSVTFSIRRLTGDGATVPLHLLWLRLFTMLRALLSQWVSMLTNLQTYCWVVLRIRINLMRPLLTVNICGNYSRTWQWVLSMLLGLNRCWIGYSWLHSPRLSVFQLSKCGEWVLVFRKAEHARRF